MNTEMSRCDLQRVEEAQPLKSTPLKKQTQTQLPTRAPGEHHPTLPPSSFPALALCPCFKSGKGSSAATEGTNQHALLEECLSKGIQVGSATKEFTGPVSTEGLADVRFAVEEVDKVTDPALRELEVRLELSTINDDFEREVITFGSADILQKLDDYTTLLIDYKSGEFRDYRLQMLVYARAAMDKHSTTQCKVIELYGKKRHLKEYMVTYAETAVVFDVVAMVNDPAKKPNPCERCSWCEYYHTCPALVQHVTAAAVEYNERKRVDKKYLSSTFVPELEQRLKSYDLLNFEDPEELGLIYSVAEIVGKWASSVKTRIVDEMKAGREVNGYKIKNSSTSGFDKDISAQQIFELSGLTVDEFMPCCSVTVGELKKTICVKAGLVDEEGNSIRVTNKPAIAEFNAHFSTVYHKVPTQKIAKVKVSDG